MLMTIVGQYPFVDSWLTIKVMLVLLYIMLGYMALRGASTRRRWASFGAAAATYGFVITVARARPARHIRLTVGIYGRPSGRGPTSFGP